MTFHIGCAKQKSFFTVCSAIRFRLVLSKKLQQVQHTCAANTLNVFRLNHSFVSR